MEARIITGNLKYLIPIVTGLVIIVLTIIFFGYRYYKSTDNKPNSSKKDADANTDANTDVKDGDDANANANVNTDVKDDVNANANTDVNANTDDDANTDVDANTDDDDYDEKETLEQSIEKLPINNSFKKLIQTVILKQIEETDSINKHYFECIQYIKNSNLNITDLAKKSIEHLNENKKELHDFLKTKSLMVNQSKFECFIETIEPIATLTFKKIITKNTLSKIKNANCIDLVINYFKRDLMVFLLVYLKEHKKKK